MTHLPLRLASAAVFLAAALAACGDPTGPRGDLAAARRRWDATEPAAYEFVLRRLCFCAPPATDPVVITVRGGAVESRRYLGTGEAVDPGLAAAFPAMEGVFAYVDSAIAQHADRVEATYDPARGYPVQISIDYYANAVDDEVAYLVSDFRVR